MWVAGRCRARRGYWTIHLKNKSIDLMSTKSFFLRNTNTRQTIFKNTFWLVLAEAVSRLLGLILIIFVARTFGALEYGKFTFALSFVSVMVIFADLGLVDVITREFSRDRSKERDFSIVVTLHGMLSFASLLLMVIGSFFITNDAVIRSMIWVLGVFILITNFFGIFYAFLRSRQKMEYEAIFKMIQSGIMTVLAFFVIFYIPSVINLSYGYLISNTISLCLLVSVFYAYFHPIKLSFDRKMLGVLKLSWPLTFGFINSWIFIFINSVILGYFGLIAQNGWYSAASKIALVAAIPADIIVRSFYPVLSDFFITSREKLQRSWDYLMEMMIFLTIPLVTGGIALASKVIYFFYGSDFAPSAFAFQLLMMVIGISFIIYPFSVILVVFDQQKKNFTLIIVGVFVNIILSILFIGRYGFYGVIMSTAISFLIILLLTIVIAAYMTSISLYNINFLKSAFLAGTSSLIMYAVINLSFTRSLPIYYLVLIGVLTYITPLCAGYLLAKKYNIISYFL